MEESFQIGLDLGSTSPETIELFMSEASDPAIFREILEANRERTEILNLLREHPETPEEVRAEAASALGVAAPSEEDIRVQKIREAERKAREIQEKHSEDRLINRIHKLSVSEKIKFAMRGNKEIRGILLKDSNRMVVLAVLDNAKITEPEVEAVARSRQIMEDALRVIAKNREWMKSYSVQLALVTNPKTPMAIAMKFVTGLKKKDLQLLEKNRNVPEGVRTAAKKALKPAKA